MTTRRSTTRQCRCVTSALLPSSSTPPPSTSWAYAISKAREYLRVRRQEEEEEEEEEEANEGGGVAG